MILKVPNDLKVEFLRDAENFVRDKCCIPFDSISPFVKRRDLIFTAFDYAFKNPFNEKTLKFEPGFHCENPHTPRFAHIDLAVNRDAVGISMCHAPHFISVKQMVSGEYKETMVPYIKFDFIGRITVNANEEIILADIQDIIYELSRRAFFFKLITFDRFQSVSTIQDLRAHGYICGNLSVDRTTHKLVVDPKADGFLKKYSTEREYAAAAQELKLAIYRRGIALPYHAKLEQEIKEMEYNAKANRVEKRAGKTDDIFQSVAGSCFNLMSNTRFTHPESQAVIDGRSDPFYKRLDQRGDDGYLSGDQEKVGPEDDFYEYYESRYNSLN